MRQPVFSSLLLAQTIILTSLINAELVTESPEPMVANSNGEKTEAPKVDRLAVNGNRSGSVVPETERPDSPLDGRFAQDIAKRLHALDEDINRLVLNSTSALLAAEDQGIQKNSKGGEKFTQVLEDLDSLQDEIGVLSRNATRTRQYNIAARLRPLNNILYRIRHNLHLMRNSLVAINAVSSLEKIGNSVLDTTLQAFMKPDANLADEVGDDGNYSLDLDKPQAETQKIAPDTKPKPEPPVSTSAPAPPVTSSTTPAPAVASESKPPATRNRRPSRNKPARTTGQPASTAFPRVVD